MKMVGSGRFGLLVLCMVLVLGGCRRKEEKTVESAPRELTAAERLQQEEEALRTLTDSAKELLNSGKTNDLVTLFLSAYDEGDFDQLKPRVFGYGQWALLQAGETALAEKRFIDTCNQNVAMAVDTLGMIYQDKMRREDTNTVYQWTETLLTLPLPTNQMPRVALMQLEAAAVTGRLLEMETLGKGILERLPGTQGEDVLKRGVTVMRQRRKYTSARYLLKVLEGVHEGDEQWDGEMAILRIELLLAEEKWPEAEDLFLKWSDKWEPSVTAKQLDAIARYCTAAKQFSSIAMLCERMLTTKKDVPDIRRAAARQYLNLSIRNSAFEELPDRTLSLLDRVAVPAVDIADLFSDHVYSVFKRNDAAISRKAMAVLQRLIADLKAAKGDDEEWPLPETAVRRLYDQLIDGCFLCEEYDVAIALLDGDPIPGKEPQDQQAAAVKMKAHKALKENRVDDAVSGFRAFMKLLPEDPVTDPTTGMAYTRAMCLGFNAKRIGDIYTKANRADEAAAAYAEARTYYQEALEESKEGSRQRTVIQEEMSKIPAVDS